MGDDRLNRLRDWLRATLGEAASDLVPASGDASFRRYWRLCYGDGTLIAVDAPPATENTAAFVRMADALGAVGLNVPEILARDLEQGFLLVRDLGTRLYLDCLTPDNADRLYGDAIGALMVMQSAGPVLGLPDYDAPFLRRELGIFDEWLLGGLLGLRLTAGEQALLDESYALLIESALAQPRVCVHRDYHSRNLMLTDSVNPGILDFQDAVLGPVTYDLVSLLKDCYIDWPRERVLSWAGGYFDLAVQTGVLRPEDEAAFPRWFDLMGAQRHLKAAGIFARLALRDGKRGYLQYLPRTLGYVTDLGPLYGDLAGLAAFIADKLTPVVARLDEHARLS